MTKLFTLLLLTVAAGWLGLGRDAQPAEANPLMGVVSISSGGPHSCAVLEDTRVKCWGNGEYGELGNGTNDDGDPTLPQNAALIPVDVCATLKAPGVCDEVQSGINALTSGAYHVCAITTEGGVKCWGWNESGQLGAEGVYCTYFAFQFPCSNVPIDVPGLDSGVTSISGGWLHTCAVLEGAAKCWGSFGGGVLGDGSVFDADPATPDYTSSPVQVAGLDQGVLTVAASADHTCALMQDGTVRCWGSNGLGQLGDGGVCGALCPTAVDVAGLQGAVALVTGPQSSHTCALINDGTVKCWGQNAIGMLGDGGACGTACATPTTVALDEPAASIAVGIYHTCAVTVDGGVKCWGSNISGESGDGTRQETYSLPVDVLGLNAQADAVSAGLEFTCARTNDGQVKCWGTVWQSQIGDGFLCNHLQYRLACPLPVSIVNSEAKIVPGDANCSRTVDSVDVALILQFNAGLMPALHCPALADVTLDGAMNSLDAAVILQYIAGLTHELCADTIIPPDGKCVGR